MKGNQELPFLLLITLISKISGQRPPPIQPIVFSLPPPPSLTGELSSNNILTNAERVHQNYIQGPASFVNHNGHLYSSTVDSKIYDLASCPPRLITNLAPPGCMDKYTCGQITSLRLEPATGSLLALDTFRGLFSVNPETGSFKVLFHSNTFVNGRRPVHLNDMIVSSDGVIMMTDSSDTYSMEYDVYICMDGRPTGRILALHPRNGFITELVPGYFNFPNGLELTPDGDLLVTETCRAAVHRISLKRHSWLQVTPFSLNLPGLPDNIRSSGRGTYWVAMTYARHAGSSNPVDEYSGNPRYRSMGYRMMSLQTIRDMFTKWGIIVELDARGRVLTTLHDPTGSTLSTISEVNEYGGVLNIGSHLVNYMVRIIQPSITQSKSSVESLIQVKKSRCQLSDSQADEIRRQLLPTTNGTTTARPTVTTSAVAATQAVTATQGVTAAR
ncbi:hypothetical protein BsWGS_01250 [Bradybaena similaris]